MAAAVRQILIGVGTECLASSAEATLSAASAEVKLFAFYAGLEPSASSAGVMLPASSADMNLSALYAEMKFSASCAELEPSASSAKVTLPAEVQLPSSDRMNQVLVAVPATAAAP